MTPLEDLLARVGAQTGTPNPQTVIEASTGVYMDTGGQVPEDLRLPPIPRLPEQVPFIIVGSFNPNG